MNKYKIQKTNGEPIDPEAKYFVLRYDAKSKDRYARQVLSIYAARTGNEALHNDLRKELLLANKLKLQELP